MFEFEEISENLVKCDPDLKGRDFVASAVDFFEGHHIHAGILICKDNVYKIFHFLPNEIKKDELKKAEWHFYKKLDFIPPSLIPSFINHCDKIKKFSQPQYGYFIDNSYYKDGVFYSEAGLAEYMTCVGFCINVISGFLESEKYFEVTDWDEKSVRSDFFEKFVARNPGIDINLYKPNIRRITPIEYLAGAFIKSIPIRKSTVDQVTPHLQRAISI